VSPQSSAALLKRWSFAGLPASRAAELNAEVVQGYDHAMMMSGSTAAASAVDETQKSPEPAPAPASSPTPARPKQGLI
jgi:hypothetical protein